MDPGPANTSGGPASQPDATGDPDDLPVPNPPPLPGDVIPTRLPSPRGALRASLLIWGWGQIAAGDRRGWLGPPAQLGALLVVGWLAPALAGGTSVSLAFLLGAAVLAAWALVAVDAHRRTARRLAAVDLPAGHDGAADLLWLAPAAIVLSTLLWAGGGRAADPGVVLDQYVGDWGAGRTAAGIARFAATPGGEAEVRERWAGQLAGLRNELVRLAAELGEAADIDPDRPLETVRWTDGGPLDGGRGRLVVVEVVRREAVRSLLFGFVPTTSQRLVTIARLGEVRLRLVPAGSGPGEVWRIVRVEVGGIPLGG
jgi:hypothetical protein